jgi:hypothetical protein
LRGTPVEDRPSNDLLRRLTDQDYELLAPFLDRADLPSNKVLYHPGEDVQTVFFPCETSAASFMVTIEDGRDVQTVLVGHEGAVGGIISHGFSPAFSRSSYCSADRSCRCQFASSSWHKPSHDR